MFKFLTDEVKNLRKARAISELNASHQTLVDMYVMSSYILAISFIVSLWFPYVWILVVESLFVFIYSRQRWYYHLKKWNKE